MVLPAAALTILDAHEDNIQLLSSRDLHPALEVVQVHFCFGPYVATAMCIYDHSGRTFQCPVFGKAVSWRYGAGDDVALPSFLVLETSFRDMDFVDGKSVYEVRKVDVAG